MLLDVELPPIPGNVEEFIKMVPSKLVDPGVILPDVGTMTVGPKPSHNYQLRLNSLRKSSTSSSGKIVVSGPSIIPSRWADFRGQLYSKQERSYLSQPKPHADVNSPYKQPPSGIPKRKDCTLISSFWPYLNEPAACDDWPTIPQFLSFQLANQATSKTRAPTVCNRNYFSRGVPERLVEYTIPSGSMSMSIYPKGIKNLSRPL